jgi:hypothetical protein
VAPAIVEPKRPGKAALKEPEERAEVAVEVEFDMIGARSGGRRKRDRRRRRDESRRRRFQGFRPVSALIPCEK